ncbi:hypothetical protein OF83DRAFT_595745 [Amylostereum chailletii]|nr:hypothetical protein OF83DRAFT_595745 [Amylostereum chailletii]
MATAMQDKTTSEALEAYAKHPFDTDVEYQQGLVGITSSGVLDGLSKEEKRTMMRRTRVFYFNKMKGYSISEDDAKRIEGMLCIASGIQCRKPVLEQSPAALASPSPSQTSGTESSTAIAQSSIAEEPRVLSFAELQELILQGKTDQIPNNKHIPDILNDAPPSQSIAAPKKKPWETD